MDFRGARMIEEGGMNMEETKPREQGKRTLSAVRFSRLPAGIRMARSRRVEH